MWPLLRFHLASGVRVTVRLLMPLVVVYSVLVGFFGPDLVHNLARILFPRPATGIATLLLVGSLYAAAHQASRLLTPGSRSWLRHLPSSRRQQRIATIAAITVAKLPVTLGLVALASLAASLEGRSIAFAVICVLMMSSGVAVAAETRSAKGARAAVTWLLSLAAAACFAQADGRATILGVALFALVVVELATRPATPTPRRSVTASSTDSSTDRDSPATLHWRILWRSCGMQLFSGWAAALLPVGAGLFFILNNELPLRYQLLGLRLGAGLGVALTLLSATSVMIERRTPWPWVRSLPETSRERIKKDATILALLAAFPAIVTALAARQPLVLATSLPLILALALRAAGTVASCGVDRTRGPGAFAAESLSAAALVSLVPWVSLVLVPSLPWLFHRAGLRDRRAPVTAFQELRAARDPLAGADS